jgi:hypothetical protein
LPSASAKREPASFSESGRGHAEALRKALGVIKGLRRHVSDTDEDLIVSKLLEELDVAGYEIVKKPGNAGFIRHAWRRRGGLADQGLA